MEENKENSTDSTAMAALPGAPAEGMLPPGKSSKKPAVFAAVIIVVLAAGAFAAYASYYSPAKVWNRFAAKEVPKVASYSFNFSYEDKGKVTGEAANNPMSSIFSNIKFSFSGTGYNNAADLNNPEATADINYSLGSGDTSISSKAQMVVKSKDIYMNFGNNPIVNSIMSMASGGEKVEWIKINAEEIEKASKTGTSTQPGMANFSEQAKALQGIVEKHRTKIFTLDKYLDKQEIRQETALHYSAKLNKDEAKAMFNEVFDYMFKQMKENGGATQEEAQQAGDVAKKVVTNLVDRLEVKSLEVWIGQKDNELKKLKLSSNAPSFVSFFSAASNSDQNEKDPNKIADQVLKDLSFDADLGMEEEFYDFGKTREVKAPENALDIAKKIQEQKEAQKQYENLPLDVPAAPER